MIQVRMESRYLNYFVYVLREEQDQQTEQLSHKKK